MKMKKVVALAVVAALALSAVALTGCTAKKKSIIGEWKLEQTTPTTIIIITEKEFKLPNGRNVAYTLDEKKGTITLDLGTTKTNNKYKIADDNKSFTLTESTKDASGKVGSSTIKFTRLSEKTTGTPRTEGSKDTTTTK